MDIQIIQSKIHTLRGQSVLLDFDLAVLYEVQTKALNQAVKRNIERFPEDFMFQLSLEEWQSLRSSIVTTSQKHREEKSLPYAYTEHGVAMLSSVLRSKKAIQVNIAIMRAFVKLRHYALTFTELAQKITELEAKTGKDIADIHEVLHWLGEQNQARAAEIAGLEPSSNRWKTRRPIGF
jgi:phage regulator Rha-like protein